MPYADRIPEPGSDFRIGTDRTLEYISVFQRDEKLGRSALNGSDVTTGGVLEPMPISDLSRDEISARIRWTKWIQDKVEDVDLEDERQKFLEENRDKIPPGIDLGPLEGSDYLVENEWMVPYLKHGKTKRWDSGSPAE